MRIAIVNWNIRKIGGAESYLDAVVPALDRLGHELAIFSEIDLPRGHPRISLPQGVPRFSVSDGGAIGALGALRAWRPDVLFAHGLMNVEIEARALDIAPAMLFAHNYYGACISELKTFKRPDIRPCDRRFGWQCLLHYYPRRCGGLNPLSMWSAYRLQAARLSLIRKYSAVVVASEHMRREYLKYQLPSGSVHTIPLPVSLCGDAERLSRFGCESKAPRIAEPVFGPAPSDQWRLLFVGRMTSVKGGALLLDALENVVAALARPIHMTFAGDGPDCKAWEERARLAQLRQPRLTIHFTKWLDKSELSILTKRVNLLVMPSVWPEPFGLAGPELGLAGVPAAAFAVGGISEWLTDGVNGRLAPADPPTVAGLARAIISCLCERSEYRRLCRGAADLAQRFSMEAHLAGLVPLLVDTARQRIHADSKSARACRV